MRVCAPVGVLVPLLGVDVLQRASERVLCVFVSIQQETHPVWVGSCVGGWWVISGCSTLFRDRFAVRPVRSG
jgi:hypothetical protein